MVKHTKDNLRSDWLVMTFKSGSSVTSWKMRGRTKREAYNEAVAEVVRMGALIDDWAIVETVKNPFKRKLLP